MRLRPSCTLVRDSEPHDMGMRRCQTRTPRTALLVLALALALLLQQY